MTTKIGGDRDTLVELNFHTLSNFQSKKDTESGKSMVIGLFNAKDLIDIPVTGNVRDYLKLNIKTGEHKVNTGVHAQIYDTLLNRPEDFHLLNGGLTLIADAIYERDNNKKRISLVNPQLINGAQTQGVLKTFFNEYNSDINVKVEIILVTTDELRKELFDDISIARNQQNHVKAISIAGKKKYLDRLDEVTSVALRKNESQKELFDTEKLIQLIFAYMPKDIFKKVFPKRKSYTDKSFVYSSKSTIFKTYSNIVANIEEDKISEDIFENYILSVADDILNFYLKFRMNYINIIPLIDKEKFKKQGYKINIDKSDKSKKVLLADGLIFPIISTLSIFSSVNEDGKYIFNLPSDRYIKSVVSVLVKSSDVLNHGNVQTLGKSKISYEQTFEMCELLLENNKLEDYYNKS